MVKTEPSRQNEAAMQLLELGLLSLEDFIAEFQKVRQRHGLPEESVQLTTQQREVVKAIDAGVLRISIRSGHGIGKSFLLAQVICWFMCSHPEAVCPITGAVFETLKRTLFKEVKRAFQRLPYHLRNRFIVGQADVKRKAGESFAILKTASVSNPEAMAGFHEEHLLMIYDEASAVPEAVFESAVGSMSTPGAICIMCGNPTRLSGTFYDSHHKHSGSWKRFHFSSEDSPRVDPAFAQEIIAKHTKDSNQYRIRVAGDFPMQEEDTLIPLADIQAAVERDTPVDEFEDLVYGLDVAWKGNDLSVNCRRRGNVCLGMEVINNKTITELVGRVCRDAHNENAERVQVDEIGVGAGALDGVTELCPRVDVRGINFAANPKDGGEYRNIRAEAYGELRDRFQQGTISIPDDSELVAELSSIEYTYTSRGLIQLEPKEQLRKRLGRSPDRADALALAFYDAGSGLLIGAA